MIRRLILLFAIAIVVVAVMPTVGGSRVSGNGDSVEIFRGREGRYELVLGVQPPTPVVGAVHFTITLLDSSTSLPVPHAVVTLVAKDPGNSPAYRTRAVNSTAFSQFYEANLTFESAGAWTLVVDVSSSSMGEATFMVPFSVGPSPLAGGVGGTVAWVIVVSVLSLGGFIVWRSIRKAHSRRA